MIRDEIRKVIDGNGLSDKEMERVMGEIIDGGASPSQVASFVTALRMKGETVEEITGAARALRKRIARFPPREYLIDLDRDDINVEEETILETSDMGKDGTKTFNVSTATALVVAAAGVPVARYGNRSVSRRFGSAEVLEHLGVNLDLSHSDVERCLDEIGIAFYFAPISHGPMRYVARIRMEIGMRTIFNLMAPFANPASASSFMLGVYRPERTEIMANVLRNLGAKRGFVVHGEKTIDEISICGNTKIAVLENGNISHFLIEPEEFGMKRVSLREIRGGNAGDNAAIIRDILGGTPGAKRDIVLLNAGAAFVAAGVEEKIRSGIDRASEMIDSGKASEKLAALVEFTRTCEPFVRKEW